jgi:O-antigen/teichoic acid export membrane protein
MARIGNFLGRLIQKGIDMSKDKLFGIVRTIAAAGFGFLAGKGYLDGATAEALAGAVATIGVAIWSVVSKKSA